MKTVKSIANISICQLIETADEIVERPYGCHQHLSFANQEKQPEQENLVMPLQPV